MATIRRIRLPKSAPGNAGAHVKLLYAIDPPGTHSLEGMGWRGRVFAPGSRVTESELRPGPDFPERPLVLELAGRLGRLANDPYHWILWELGPNDEWTKLASTEAMRDEWAREFYPIAARALKEQGVGRVPPNQDLNRLTKKFQRFIDKQIEPLGLRQKALYLGMIRNLISRMVDRLLEFPPPETSEE